MGKQAVYEIDITTTVTLKGTNKEVITSVTTSDSTIPGVYSSEGNANLLSAVAKIHQVTKELGERVAIQAAAGVKDLGY